MKKVVFAVWDNPEWYNTVIFSAKAFVKKDYQVHLIYFSPDKKENINVTNFQSQRPLPSRKMIIFAPFKSEKVGVHSFPAQDVLANVWHDMIQATLRVRRKPSQGTFSPN